jgi:hypothetical protein
MARRKQDAVSKATLDKGSAEPVENRDELDERLAVQLVEHARAEGTSLVGPDGLLGKLNKLVFSARHAGPRSDGMGTVSDDIGACDST